jgi:hypothetical protein
MNENSVCMSSFLAIKLDNYLYFRETLDIMARPNTKSESSIMRRVRDRIERGGERVWKLDDFRDLPFSAVAQALSRLSRDGRIERLSKGVYYRSRTTALGKSQPNPTSIRQLSRKSVFPSGLAAASLLGFTTQMGRSEVATSALSLPRKLVGSDTIVHTRRPEAWERLQQEDAALLDFLRHSGRFSELPPQETIRKTMTLLHEPERWNRLVKVGLSDPPRVRALLGALGEQLGADRGALRRLRSSLNPYSRFEFGPFAALPNARGWFAKGGSKMKLFEHPDF